MLLHSDAVYGYDTKPADSEGLALGTVTLPWTFTALLITDLLQKGSSGKAMVLCKLGGIKLSFGTGRSLHIHARYLLVATLLPHAAITTPNIATCAPMQGTAC